MDDGIQGSIAKDGRINRYVEECIRANNNGSIAAATTELQQFKTPTNDRLASLEDTYQTLTANLKSTNDRLDDLDTEVADLTYPTPNGANKTPTTTVNPATDNPDIVTPCTGNQPLTSQRWTNVKLSPINPPVQPTAQPPTSTIPPATAPTEPSPRPPLPTPTAYHHIKATSIAAPMVKSVFACQHQAPKLSPSLPAPPLPYKLL